jgi:hypothetical protein
MLLCHPRGEIPARLARAGIARGYFLGGATVAVKNYLMLLF